MTETASSILELLDRLQRGATDQADIDFLEHSHGPGIVADLGTNFPVLFQERTVGHKREVALARSVRPRVILARQKSSDSLFLSMLMIPVYVDCVLVNLENDAITGISRYRRLSIRPAHNQSEPALLITTSPTFKLALTPDGWEKRRLKKSTAQLTKSFLANRGWLFHPLSQFIPIP